MYSDKRLTLQDQKNYYLNYLYLYFHFVVDDAVVDDDAVADEDVDADDADVVFD